MHSKMSRKEIQDSIEVSLNAAFERLKISDPSKRLRKIAKKASQKLSGELKSELKKLAKGFRKEQKGVKSEKSQPVRDL
jgi:hypothetical protein